MAKRMPGNDFLPQGKCQDWVLRGFRQSRLSA